MLSLSVVAIALVGCSEYDNGFDSKRMKFSSDFTREIGSFDSRQDWNMSERASVTVITSARKNINIYLDQNGSFKQVGRFNAVEGVQLLTFDAEKDVDKIVVSDGENAMRTVVGGSVSFDDMISSDGNIVATRAHDVNRNEWESKYIIPAPISDTQRNKVLEEFSKPYYGAVNTTVIPWDKIFIQQVYKGLSEYKDGNGTSVGKGSDHMNHLSIYNKNIAEGMLNDIGNHFEHVSDFNTANQNSGYNNIQDLTLMIDLNSADVPTQRIKNVDGVDVDWVKQFAYHNSTDNAYHAEYILRKIDGELYLGFDFYAVPPAGQEANKNMSVKRDWVFNDWIIKLNKATDAIVATEALDKTELSGWILAAEDLGGDFDVDYNDVVVRIEHVSGDNTAYITPLAAGGTLASYLFFGTTCVGEIHQLLGASPAVSGRYQPINIEAGKPIRFGQKRSVTVGADWTISSDESKTGNMGGFSIKVLPLGAPAQPMRLNDFDEAFDNSTVVSAPERGSAPYIICIPYSYTLPNTPQNGQKTTKVWAWPNENMRISKAYADFDGWVLNRKANKKWYAKPVSAMTFETDAIASQHLQGSSTQSMTEEENKAMADLVNALPAFENPSPVEAPIEIAPEEPQEEGPYMILGDKAIKSGAKQLGLSRRTEYKLEFRKDNATGKIDVYYRGNLVKSNAKEITVSWFNNYTGIFFFRTAQAITVRSNGGEYNMTIPASLEGSCRITDLDRFKMYQERAIYFMSNNGGAMYMSVK